MGGQCRHTKCNYSSTSIIKLTCWRRHKRAAACQWKDRFTNMADNLACVLHTVNHRADASQRVFTVINQVTYKQANKNKWLQYNSAAPLHACLLVDEQMCVLGVINEQRSSVCVGYKKTWTKVLICGEIQNDVSIPHKWEQSLWVCVFILI